MGHHRKDIEPGTYGLVGPDCWRCKNESRKMINDTMWMFSLVLVVVLWFLTLSIAVPYVGSHATCTDWKYDRDTGVLHTRCPEAITGPRVVEGALVGPDWSGE